MKFELFQRVRITVDYPEEHVTAGDEGVVMDTIPAKNDMPAGYSVELSSGHPHPLGVAMLTEKQLEKVSENGLVLNQLADEPKLLQILSILNEYAEVYSNNDSCSRSPQAFINGRPQNITDAGWLYYEGTSAWFPSKLLNEALPLLVKPHPS